MQASRAEAASQDAAQPQPEAAGITVEAGSAAPPPAEEILLRPPAEAGQRDVKDLIDSVVSRHAQDEPPAPPPPAFTPLSPPEAGPQPEPDVQRRLEFERSPRPSPGRKPAPSPEPDSTPAWMLPTQETRVPDPMNSGEDKLILLSRTLAGLVDLILIILCAGAMIFAVDILEGIEVWDAVTKFHFALIFLATYFVYSFFFLGMSNQTIGMMLTDLMVVDSASGRAGTPQILVRCLLFPFSLALFGIGLLWGCFDRHTRCLHDLLSGTRVTRIQS
jgi:uncharacterized RDD family membrane protein YckC